MKHVTKSTKFSEQPQKEIINAVVQNINRLEEGKTISIEALPDCLSKARYLNIVQDAKQAKVVVLAILDPVENTWEAFIGWPDVRDLKPSVIMVDQPFLPAFDFIWYCENIRDVEQVKILGDLLSKDVAIQLFPDWKGKKYHEEDY